MGRNMGCFNLKKVPRGTNGNRQEKQVRNVGLPAKTETLVFTKYGLSKKSTSVVARSPDIPLTQYNNEFGTTWQSPNSEHNRGGLLRHFVPRKDVFGTF